MSVTRTPGRGRGGPLARRGIHLSRPQIGALTAAIVALIAVGCYTKFANPFASPFQIEGTFANANGLLPGSPVRIAGVQVGTVASVQAVNGGGAGHAAEVTMTLDPSALPLHSDATFDIRPRIFLEGNFFVDLHPGTPEAPTVRTGHVFPIGAGREPVQFDQLLTSLQSSTRASLQTLIQQYGLAVKRGGPDYNASIPYWLPAYKYSSVVSHDFLGTQPNDIENYVANGAVVSRATDANPAALEDLIVKLDQVAATLNGERANLAATVRELPVTLSAATPTFQALDTALPQLDRFATSALPGVRSSGPASVQALPLITQLRGLVQPAELQGLARTLSFTAPALARLTRANLPLLAKQVRPVSSCFVNNIYPWSQLSINDGNLNATAGEPVRKVFQEGVDYLPGLAGESRDFDANGPYIRVLLTGGSLTYSLSPGLFGQALAPITAVQPQLPAGGVRPPLRSGTPCERSAAITQAGIQAAPGGPIPSVKSNLAAPGAQLRWASAVTAAIGQIEHQAASEHVGVRLDPTLVTQLTAELHSGLAGVPNGTTLLNRALHSIGLGG
ncbi:MAG TPA: MlaD family protein [Solirubrobacteraceae bacterium]|nr:MlaD family protein [Solirubrobacteraceae bacterium]